MNYELHVFQGLQKKTQIDKISKEKNKILLNMKLREKVKNEEIGHLEKMEF